MTDEYIPHFLRGLWVGPLTSFWSTHTIAAQTVHSPDTSFNWDFGSLKGAIGSFKCSNNNPIFCALDFGLAFIADMNVSNRLYLILLYLYIIYCNNGLIVSQFFQSNLAVYISEDVI